MSKCAHDRENNNNGLAYTRQKTITTGKRARMTENVEKCAHMTENVITSKCAHMTEGNNK